MVDMKLSITSRCLWKLATATDDELSAMEFVFGNIAPGAGHSFPDTCFEGCDDVYGFNVAFYGGSTFDVKEWHEALKEHLWGPRSTTSTSWSD